MNSLPKLIDTVQQGISVAAANGGLDVDMIHAMEERDNALIADEILNGALSSAFVYNFSIQGTAVVGVSVVGARHLAHHYGGIRHRIVASIEKRGSLFTFKSYPWEGSPMQVNAQFIHELAEEPDFYTAVVEICDVKKGNTVQIERTEMRFEKKRDGGQFERPNFQTIAQSKAYRNGVLAVVPQDVKIQFQQQCVKLGKSVDLSESAIDKKRQGILSFAAKNSIPIDRDGVYELDMAQITGLGECVRELGVNAFQESLVQLGLLRDAKLVIESNKQQGGGKPAAGGNGAGGGGKQTAPKEADKTDDSAEKANLAAYALEYGITLDKRKKLSDLQEEVQQIRDGTHPGMRSSETPHDDDGVVTEEDGDGDDGEGGTGGGDGGFNFNS